MTKKSSSLLLVQPTEYFHGAVAGAIGELKVTASDEAKLYLTGLLTKFLSTENLFPSNEAGEYSDTLVMQLASALEQERVNAKRERLRHMGDYSLYIAGFFSDSLAQKLVDVDYYIGMGGNAYGAAAQLCEKKAETVLFSELSEKFPKFVDVLAQVSEESAIPKDPSDLLRTYDLWTKTGSDRLAGSSPRRVS